MGLLPFVAAGAFVVLVWAVALGLVFVVGAVRGGRAALDFFLWTFWIGLAAIAGVLIWALVSHQWRAFTSLYGAEALAEMALGAFLLIFTMAWTAGSYANTKLRSEAEAAGKAARDESELPHDATNDSETTEEPAQSDADANRRSAPDA